MSSTDPQRVRIFDTTLRDGEQSPGISLNTIEKLEIAHQLARLGVDVIEAGFPIASPGDFEAVQAIAREVHGPIIAGLARAQAPDIDAAARAVHDAERPAHPHVHLHVGHPHRAPVPFHARGRQGPGPGRGRACAVARGGRRVLADGRHARRPGVHGRGLRDRRRGGRDDDQHPRHRRLHDADEYAAFLHGLYGLVPGLRDVVRRCTATTTSAWRWRTPTPGCSPARGRSSARSTASASAPATRRWRRS